MPLYIIHMFIVNNTVPLSSLSGKQYAIDSSGAISFAYPNRHSVHSVSLLSTQYEYELKLIH